MGSRITKFLEHLMNVVECVLAKRLCRIAIVNEIQFGFLPERGIIDAVFSLSRLQEEYHA